jgi:hypothetical protein
MCHYYLKGDTMPRKKVIKLKDKMLTVCPTCKKPILKERMTENRIALINENVSDHNLEELPLS